MYIRPAAGIAILLLLILAAPASALLSSGEIGPSMKTGTVWVTLRNINGTTAPENIAVAYAAGDVAELPADLVIEDVTSGMATFTLPDSGLPDTLMIRPLDGTFVDGTGGYVINTVTVTKGSEPLLTNNLMLTTSPSVASYYADRVPPGKQHEWIDLDWKDPAKDLDLTVYAPDETFGPYSDSADGKKDGRIFLDIASRLNVTPGHWFFRVTNSQGSRVPYTLNTYSA